MQTMSKEDKRESNAPVDEVRVYQGKLLVTPAGGIPAIVEEGETFEVGGRFATIVALESSNYSA